MSRRRALTVPFLGAFVALTAVLGAFMVPEPPRAPPVVVEAASGPGDPGPLDGLSEALHARAVAIWTFVAASTPPSPPGPEEGASRSSQGQRATGGGGDPGLAGIRACESGGNYQANTGNGYYGAYQFDRQTWASVGGSGLPSNASPAEQDMRARTLQAQRGSSPWPVCGRR